MTTPAMNPAVVAAADALDAWILAGGYMQGDPIPDEADLARVAVAAARPIIVAEVLTFMSRQLPQHLAEPRDPCRERGANWPCDVVQAFRATADALKPAKSTNDGETT